MLKLVTMRGQEFLKLFPGETIDRAINNPLTRVWMDHSWYKPISYNIQTDTLTLKYIISDFT